jgi:hypothetical protein
MEYIKFNTDYWTTNEAVSVDVTQVIAGLFKGTVSRKRD